MKQVLLILCSYLSGILIFDSFFFSFSLLPELFIFSLVIGVFLLLSFLITSRLRNYFSVFVALFFFSAGGIQFYYSQDNLRAQHFENHWTKKSQLLLKTIDVSPTSTGKSTKVIGEVIAVIKDEDTIFTTGKLLAYLEKSDISIQTNQLLLTAPYLTKITNQNNPGEFNAEHYWKYQKIHYQTFLPDYRYVVVGNVTPSIFSIFTSIRNSLSSIIDTYVSGQESAVAKGLILGDRSSIESETTRMFGNTGVMHILAVSGMHVAVLVLILNYLLQLFPQYITKKNALIISLLLVWFYSLLTGFSASVARAAWMFTLIASSTLLNRTYSPISGLLFSALIILILEPFSIYDIGFQLSYAAMIGIYAFYPYLKKQLFFKHKWIRSIWEGVALSIAAQLITTPLALYYFHQFPNYFLLTNIALSAYSLVILSLGLGLFVTGWWTLLGKGIGFLLFGVMFSMLWIIQFVDNLPESVSEGFIINGWLVLLLYVLIATFYWSLQKKRFYYLLTSLGFSLLIVGVIVFYRYFQMNTSHLIVFNSNNVVIALKEKEQLVLLYDKSKLKQKQLEQLLLSYRKIYPTKSYQEIELRPKTTISLSTENIKLQVIPKSDGYHLLVNNNTYFIATKSRFTPDNKKVILAPYLEDLAAFHSLKEGSFILPIKE